jgi:hypothetical protein
MVCCNSFTNAGGYGHNHRPLGSTIGTAVSTAGLEHAYRFKLLTRRTLMRVLKFYITHGKNYISNTLHLEPLSIDFQGVQPTVWCREYLIAQDRPLELHLLHTGETHPELDKLQYIASAQNPEQNYVVHLFVKP